MLKDFNDRSGGLPHRVEVAVVGAGPIGLMTANLLGLAGVRVAVLERNRGLLGLPRAIAYDAETLRLFAQVGLFGEIAPGLVQDPHVRHVNARNVTLTRPTSRAVSTVIRRSAPSISRISRARC